MLIHGMPSPKQYKTSLSDPLGICFETVDPKDCSKIRLDNLSFEDELSWMRGRMQTHPLIGTVVSNTNAHGGGQTESTTNPLQRASTGRRRSSVGGDRASAIVAQFEVADVEVDPIQPISDEEMEEEYPESEDEHAGSGSYLDEVSESGDVSLDLPTVRR